jgi:hypothetical protein
VHPAQTARPQSPHSPVTQYQRLQLQLHCRERRGFKFHLRVIKQWTACLEHSQACNSAVVSNCLQLLSSRLRGLISVMCTELPKAFRASAAIAHLSEAAVSCCLVSLLQRELCACGWSGGTQSPFSSPRHSVCHQPHDKNRYPTNVVLQFRQGVSVSFRHRTRHLKGHRGRRVSA